ncbi:hypothetical protein ES703_70733 [subsurface metagenome]
MNVFLRQPPGRIGKPIPSAALHVVGERIGDDSVGDDGAGDIAIFDTGPSYR